jgi:hypothetical protein
VFVLPHWGSYELGSDFDVDFESYKRDLAQADPLEPSEIYVIIIWPRNEGPVFLLAIYEQGCMDG